MSNILILEGWCRWDGFVRKTLREHGYRVRTRAGLNIHGQRSGAEPPEIVLIGMGGQPEQGWQLFRRLKATAPHLPVILYQVTDSGDVPTVVRAVKQALRELAHQGEIDNPQPRPLAQAFRLGWFSGVAPRHSTAGPTLGTEL